MRRFLIGFLAVIGGLVIFVGIGVAALFYFASPTEKPPPERIVLELDLRRPPAESPSARGLTGILDERVPLISEVIAAILQARDDARVAGILLIAGDDTPGFAGIQELREALAAFRSSGKFTLAYATSFGEMGNGTKSYYLATAMSEVWLQPSGGFGVTGIASQTPFLRRALDKLGVAAEGGQREEYKSAPNTFTQEDFTQPHRENMQRLVDSLYDQFIADVAKARDLPPDEVRRLVDRAPFSAADAKVARLVDRIAYRDEADSYALKLAGPGAGFVKLADYRKLAGPLYGEGPTIALIRGSGEIIPGRGEDGLQDETAASADVITRAFRDAAADPAVRAIVFRIDSPGGSYVAADTIWREAARTRAAGKPIIVSMGDVAASGGYFVALPADMILALPGTLTGSIGVYGGKPVFSGLLDTLGVKVGEIRAGANAGMDSVTRSYTPAQMEHLNRELDRVYADFTGKVAEARKLSPQQVDAVARGRVWSGRDAKEVGLVDELGGLTLAIERAKAAAGIPGTTGIRLSPFPKPRSTLDRLLSRVFGSDTDIEQREAVARALRLAGEASRQLEAAGISDRPRGVLSMPPLRLE